MVYEEIIELVKKNIKKTALKGNEKHLAVEFDIYGEGEGAFYVEVNGEDISVEPYEYYDRDAKVITTAQEIEKIIKGEKKPEESIVDGVTMIEGEVDSVVELMKLINTPVKKASTKKPAAKKAAKKVTKAEKEIVEMTKSSKKSTVAKDIKK